MNKHKLFTTSMATAVLVASVGLPVVGAQSADDISNFYKSTEKSTTGNPEVHTTTSTTPTAGGTVANNAVDINTLRNLLDQLEKSNNIYDSSKVLRQTATVNDAIASQEKMYTPDLVSNSDSVRRAAMEKVFGISLTDIPTWDNREGQESPTGGIYTSVRAMKEQAIYATNANRQELIRYGIDKKDWQPYYWFEALQSPSHFDIVNGKVVHNKNYYAYMADSTLNSLRVMVAYETDTARKEELQKIYESQVKETVQNYNAAPGISVYSVMLHHHLKDRTDLNVAPIDKEYWNSKWNNPEVEQGKSIDGTNPFYDIIKALQDGSLTGSISDGYKKPEQTQPVEKKDTTTETEKVIDKAKSASETFTSSIAVNKEEEMVEQEQVEGKQKPSFLERIVLKVKKVASLD